MNRTFLIVAMVVVCFGLSCSLVMEENHKFESLAGSFIDGLLSHNPEWATGLGDHRFDHLLSDYSPEGIEAERAFYRACLDSLEEIVPGRLNKVNSIDHDILKSSVASMLFRLETLKYHEWNPRMYNPGGAIYSLISRDFAPLPERMRNVMKRLRKIPARLEQARANLKNPPQIYTETAIRQNQGTISLIREDLDVYLSEVSDLAGEFKQVRDQAVMALEDYGSWLENELMPRSDGDFRLGDEKYRAKLRFSLHSDIPREEILQRAENDLAETQNAIYVTAIPLYEEYFPGTAVDEVDREKVVRMVLDRLAEQRPSSENVVEFAETCLKQCEDFVRERGFVTVPDEPINIIVMPEFQRGFAVAYCDSPGPLEKEEKTFYAISPPPEHWDSEQVESYFKEYNNYMMWDLTIHEAVPGHYLQIAHSNDFKAPTMVRSIFSSGTFTEGWATYSEELMVEHGFAGPELKMQQLKMRLRMIINVLLDQKIHCEQMSEQEAMDLMMIEGYQEEGEAAGKWRRACLSSTQLSTYYVGNLEMNEIREAYQEKSGEDFNQKAFHDLLLSFGSPPPKYVKELIGL
jgi:uncharacterized protein (DUF885 family)